MDSLAALKIYAILTTLAILLQTFLIMVMPRTWRARRFFTAKRNLMNIRIK